LGSILDWLEGCRTWGAGLGLVVLMLMKTGLLGTALRIVALEESKLLLTLGRRRLTTGVRSAGKGGTGGGFSILSRGLEEVDAVCLVVTLQREMG
jgi:hypothetical protein